jgi:asparagine synthase (glutamine-hydrolysing)
MEPVWQGAQAHAERLTMCGIAGIFRPGETAVPGLQHKLAVMGRLLEHRGPDGKGTWRHPSGNLGFAHQRLSIIDLSQAGAQPMSDGAGNWIAFNGEIYNYVELRDQLGAAEFTTRSDTEVILRAYRRWGTDCVKHLRGMFAFALWDEANQTLFCARDRFGIKPLYYANVAGTCVFASEAKAIMPFLPSIATNTKALAEYLTFQYTLGEYTLFEGVQQLLPGHYLMLNGSGIRVERYWDVHYEIDWDHTRDYFGRRLRELVDESLQFHLRSDVPVGSYVSGGIDSSLIHILALRHEPHNRLGFHGRFTEHPGYDESSFARAASAFSGGELHVLDITAEDFRRHLTDVIYHLDYPVAGPGSFAQFMVSRLAAAHLKVVLGGQGGDEIFGGYARYVLAYLEQCLNAAIDGTYRNGNYVVTIESIIPNLGLLREYKPMMKEFWRKGLFDPLDARYFQLIDRSSDMEGEIEWEALDKRRVFEDFAAIFNNAANVRKEAYFDKMTHFDFKCLLPALLQVEDRMSMAHGLESRVPLLDHPLVEFAATVPADVKFTNGSMKHLIKTVFAHDLPADIVGRRDKMGFPVPLKEWFSGPLREFIGDTFGSMAANPRPYINHGVVLANREREARFSRKTWGLLSLEVWHQRFHDRAREFRALLE